MVGVDGRKKGKMINTLSGSLVLIVIVAVNVTMLVLLFSKNRKISLFQQLFKQPVKTLNRTNNKKEFNSLLKKLHKFSMEEKELLIQQMFGRPVRIVKGMDKDGTSWLEDVSYYTSDNQADLNYHYEKHKDAYRRLVKMHH